MSTTDPFAGRRGRRRRSRPEIREREEALDALADRLQRYVETQIACAAAPPALLVTAGRDARVRTWQLPAGYPQARPAELRPATELLCGLVWRFVAVAYGVVAVVPAGPAVRHPAVRDWADRLGLAGATVLVYVSDGAAHRASGARLRADREGRVEFIAWHEGGPLAGSLFGPLDEALNRAELSESGPLAAATG